MPTTRLEAFSDGVLAIIITILVLELKVPHSADLDTLRPLLSAFLSYVLSFVYLGIYWNNHHHMMHAVKRVTGGVLWANLHLLFWLSLLPFVTGWMGENHFGQWPSVLYGFVLLMNAVAYTILTWTIIREEGTDSLLRKAVGTDFKGNLSLALYIVALPLPFFVPWAAQVIFVVVALIWLVPDRRIERVLPGK